MNHDNAPQPRLDLWVLDIDGTLMPSRELDNECYWRAVDDCVGGAPACLDLEIFTHVTDGGILDEWMRLRHGRAPSADERAQIRARFLELLMAARRRYPQAFAPTPGLLPWLEAHVGRPGRRVAVATGGWPHTARFKLQAAGLDRFDLPLASSDDGGSRSDIMRVARRRALSAGERSAVPVYVGDGVWDLEAARQLGWAFIGIGRGAAAERLTAAGAAAVCPDFAALAAAATRHVARGARAVRAAY